jgi:hypothetical protein
MKATRPTTNDSVLIMGISLLKRAGDAPATMRVHVRMPAPPFGGIRVKNIKLQPKRRSQDKKRTMSKLVQSGMT